MRFRRIQRGRSSSWTEEPSLESLRSTPDDAVSVDDDGQIVGLTEESRRLIRLIGLDGREETEARLLWIGIIVLAERYDPALYQRLVGFPADLPDLSRLRPPGGNSRPAGVQEGYFARRRRGTLPATY